MTTLSNAHITLARAKADLAHSASLVAAAERTEAAKRDRLATCTAELSATENPEAFSAATEAHRWASRDHGLAVKRLADVRRDHEPRVAAVAAAKAAVDAAAVEEARAEVRAALDELTQINARKRQLREWFLGVYLADPEALPDAAWAEVDHAPDEFSAEAMRVGLPMIGVSMHDPAAFGGDPRPARTRCERAAAAYRVRIADLERADVAATQEQAA